MSANKVKLASGLAMCIGIVLGQTQAGGFGVCLVLIGFFGFVVGRMMEDVKS